MNDEHAMVEEARLTALETVIEKKLKSFLEVGAALLEIREERLYRAQYATFETYCSERWGFTGARARQLMLAVKTNQDLAVELPSEAVARALQRYPAPLHDTIMLIAKAQADLLERSITASLITSIGDVLTQAAVTGAISVDGEASALDSVLTEEVFEAMQRQRQHISDSLSVKVKPAWKGTGHLDENGSVVLDITPAAQGALPAEFRVTVWPLVLDGEQE